MLSITREKDQTWWWDEYREYFENHPQFLSYLAFEDSATEIRQFHELIVPGLLQTEQYIRALLGSLDDPQMVEAGMQVRLRRQELLRRDNPPKMSFILDEAAIQRVIGGYDVMVEQLEHIKELNNLPHIDTQILPFTAGTIMGMTHSITILGLPVPDQSNVDYIVNVEDMERDTLIRDSTNAASTYLEDFNRIREHALTVAETDELIDYTIAQLAGRG